MSLGFGLGLSGAGRRRAAPWWHAYRAGPGGPLPDMVMEGEAGRLHGATRADATSLDLSGLSLDAGFTLYARGRLDYTLGQTGFPRFAEIGTAGDTNNRQVIFIYELDGRVRVASLNAGAQVFNATLSTAPQPSGQEFHVIVRFATDDYAVSLQGGPITRDLTGTLPVGLDRLFLRRTEWINQAAGHLDRLVLWTAPLSDAEMLGFSG